MNVGQVMIFSRCFRRPFLSFLLSVSGAVLYLTPLYRNGGFIYSPYHISENIRVQMRSEKDSKVVRSPVVVIILFSVATKFSMAAARSYGGVAATIRGAEELMSPKGTAKMISQVKIETLKSKYRCSPPQPTGHARRPHSQICAGTATSRRRITFAASIVTMPNTLGKQGLF
jgi:hypothetical protein